MGHSCFPRRGFSLGTLHWAPCAASKVTGGQVSHLKMQTETMEAHFETWAAVAANVHTMELRMAELRGDGRRHADISLTRLLRLRGKLHELSLGRD